jgi:hypothetical protein
MVFRWDRKKEGTKAISIYHTGLSYRKTKKKKGNIDETKFFQKVEKL